ncbi:hypothetical protein HZS61_001435 [Fusarium oxysporum f. sp. conglutinans]|uniref:Uncharacterized protein n=1 Tax=Fusarium oxysporum f. sp. conglutinans TaxID=100902 RepID=A0A8H6H4Q2_FUSOX|nr:hypothetical protein HZS61_001435 [Fusarium oxysporum f. sp. conglutinans]
MTRIKELPRRRKVVWVWVCCICGLGGMKVAVVSCPNSDQRDPRLGVAQEPRAWVLDNSPSSQDAASPTLNRALTNIELKEALQLHKYGQRFNENATDNVAAYTRRV